MLNIFIPLLYYYFMSLNSVSCVNNSLVDKETDTTRNTICNKMNYIPKTLILTWGRKNHLRYKNQYTWLPKRSVEKAWKANQIKLECLITFVGSSLSQRWPSYFCGKIHEYLFYGDNDNQIRWQNTSLFGSNYSQKILTTDGWSPWGKIAWGFEERTQAHL